MKLGIMKVYNPNTGEYESIPAIKGDKGDDYILTEADKEEISEKLKDKLPTKLPNPHPINFTGAVQGSYDGSSEMTFDIPQGGGSADKWELIDTVEADAETLVYYWAKVKDYKRICVHYLRPDNGGAHTGSIYLEIENVGVSFVGERSSTSSFGKAKNTCVTFNLAKEYIHPFEFATLSNGSSPGTHSVHRPYQFDVVYETRDDLYYKTNFSKVNNFDGIGTFYVYGVRR